MLQCEMCISIPCSSKKSMHCLKIVGNSSWSVPSVLRWMATSTVTPNTAESVHTGRSGGGREGNKEGEGRETGERERKRRERERERREGGGDGGRGEERGERGRKRERKRKRKERERL